MGAADLAVTLTVGELEALVKKAVESAMGASSRQDAEVLTLEEAADLLRMSTKSVVKAVSKRGLPGTCMGRKWRFRRPLLVRWLEEQAVKPGAPTERYASKLHAIKGGG